MSGKKQISSEQLFFLANTLEACSLDGVPAVLELGSKGALARVRDRANRTACFNWSVAARVIKEQGGRFITRQARAERNPVRNPLRQLAAA